MWSEGAKKQFFAQGGPDVLDLNIPLLDITAETKLQMEINEVIDELETIIGIVRTQGQTLDSFIGLAEERLQLGAEPGQDDHPTFGDKRRAKPHTWFRRSAKDMRLKFKDRYETLVGLKNTA